MRQQDTNLPYEGVQLKLCNTIAPSSNGLHVFVLIMDSSGGYYPVTYMFRNCC